MKKILLITFIYLFSLLFPIYAVASNENQKFSTIWMQLPKESQKLYIVSYVKAIIHNQYKWYTILKCDDINSINRDLCITYIPEEYANDELSIYKITSRVHDFIYSVFSKDEFQKLDFDDVLGIAYSATISNAKDSEFWEFIEMLSEE